VNLTLIGDSQIVAAQELLLDEPILFRSQRARKSGRGLRNVVRMEQTDQSGPRAFDQNGLAERWIASCRREILDHVIALNEEHLSRILREYIRYYHDDRLHDSPEKDAPNGCIVEPQRAVNAKVLSVARLGGLHHRYTWCQAA